jgi:uncharacterized protein involved in exopolysaccharide biosynthesis
LTRPFVSEPLVVAPPSREPASSPPLEPQQATISAVSLFNVLLRYRWMIIILSLLFGGYAGFKSVTSAKGYTAEAQFMPKGARGGGQLSGLAAQFGVNLSGGDATNSPQFYIDLLETKGLLWPIAQKQYSIKTDSGVITGDLLKLYHIKPDRPVVMKVKVIEALQRQIKGVASVKTGVITLTVVTGNPELSMRIAQNVLDQVNVYNLANRQRQAAAERAFAERQVGEKRAELRQAESELETFLETNRSYRQSPQLMLEYNRIFREVERRNLIYSSLLSAYETARIEEVKDLPVITVIEPPEMPIGPDRRGGTRKTAIGLVIGFVLGCLIAFARDRMARNREAQTDEFLEYAALKREAIGDLTHPWRPISRAMSSRRKA